MKPVLEALVALSLQAQPAAMDIQPIPFSMHVKSCKDVEKVVERVAKSITDNMYPGKEIPFYVMDPLRSDQYVACNGEYTIGNFSYRIKTAEPPAVDPNTWVPVEKDWYVLIRNDPDI